MQRSFIIATTFLGVTTAQAQTAAQFSDQTGLAADPLSIAASPLPSGPSSTPGPVAGSTSTSTSNSDVTRNINAPASRSPQSPSLLPGEISDTSTQAANATASAPAPLAPICPPPIPSSDAGSANLSGQWMLTQDYLRQTSATPPKSPRLKLLLEGPVWQPRGRKRRR